MESIGLVSIIVPVYKVEKYLERCIESIVRQTYSNIEVILVDDGSPDMCPKICDAWGNKDSRVRVIHKKNGGLSEARNAGMREATGTYLSFVDSDDFLSPEMLEKLVYSIENDNSDIAACTVEVVWENNEYQNSLLTIQKNLLLNREEAQKALLLETLLKQPVWYKLYKREMVKDLFFEVGKYHEDVFWSYQAIGRASYVSLIDHIGYFYTQRKDSIMGADYSVRRLDALEAIEKRYDYIRREFPMLEREARLSILGNCIYHGQMTLRYLSGDQKEQVFRHLNQVMRKYKFSMRDYKDKSFKKRVWLRLGSISLFAACKCRNILNIGF